MKIKIRKNELMEYLSYFPCSQCPNTLKCIKTLEQCKEYWECQLKEDRNLILEVLDKR